MIVEVAEQIHKPPALAAALLSEHEWKPKKTIDGFFDDPELLFKLYKLKKPDENKNPESVASHPGSD